MKQGVSGVGVWAALNGVKPIAVENGFLVLGLEANEFELAGHLRIPSTKKLVEAEIGRRMGQAVHLRVIEGTTPEHWERMKKRDEESRRMQEASHERAKAEFMARTNWESVFESLSRRYAAVSNKSIPMNRARFYEEAIALLVEARQGQATHDDLAERNFARCIERVAQYSEVPSTIVAHDVLKAAGEL